MPSRVLATPRSRSIMLSRVAAVWVWEMRLAGSPAIVPCRECLDCSARWRLIFPSIAASLMAPDRQLLRMTLMKQRRPTISIAPIKAGCRSASRVRQIAMIQATQVAAHPARTDRAEVLTPRRPQDRAEARMDPETQAQVRAILDWRT